MINVPWYIIISCYVLGDWYLADADTSCTDTCSNYNLQCSEDEFYKNNDDVDSSEEVLVLLQRFGITTPPNSCGGAITKFYPIYGTVWCGYSLSSRSVSTFDCGASPTSNGANKKRRLCWCHPSGRSISIKSGNTSCIKLIYGYTNISKYTLIYYNYENSHYL